MNTKQVILQLVIYVVVFQLVAWALYSFTGDRSWFAILFCGSIGAWLATWWQQRRKAKPGGGS